MSQSTRTLRDTFDLLADFFERKGDQVLTQNEVAVCLEWLQQVTQPAIFSTPATARRSARLAAAPATPTRQQPDMTPVKRQIKELLASVAGTPAIPDGAASVDNVMTAESPPAAAPTTGPIIVTRTAKTILDVLSSSGSPSGRGPGALARAKPVVALPKPSSLVTVAMSLDADEQQKHRQVHHRPSIGDNTTTLYGADHSGEKTTGRDSIPAEPDHIKPMKRGSVISISPGPPPEPATMATDILASVTNGAMLPILASDANLPTFSFDTGSLEGVVALQPTPATPLPYFHFDL